MARWTRKNMNELFLEKRLTEKELKLKSLEFLREHIKEKKITSTFHQQKDKSVQKHKYIEYIEHKEKIKQKKKLIHSTHQIGENSENTIQTSPGEIKKPDNRKYDKKMSEETQLSFMMPKLFNDFESNTLMKISNTLKGEGDKSGAERVKKMAILKVSTKSRSVALQKLKDKATKMRDQELFDNKEMEELRLKNIKNRKLFQKLDQLEKEKSKKLFKMQKRSHYNPLDIIQEDNLIQNQLIDFSSSERVIQLITPIQSPKKSVQNSLILNQSSSDLSGTPLINRSPKEVKNQMKINLASMKEIGDYRNITIGTGGQDDEIHTNKLQKLYGALRRQKTINLELKNIQDSTNSKFLHSQGSQILEEKLESLKSKNKKLVSKVKAVTFIPKNPLEKKINSSNSTSSYSNQSSTKVPISTILEDPIKIGDQPIKPKFNQHKRHYLDEYQDQLMDFIKTGDEWCAFGKRKNTYTVTNNSQDYLGLQKNRSVFLGDNSSKKSFKRRSSVNRLNKGMTNIMNSIEKIQIGRSRQRQNISSDLNFMKKHLNPNRSKKNLHSSQEKKSAKILSQVLSRFGKKRNNGINFYKNQITQNQNNSTHLKHLEKLKSRKYGKKRRQINSYDLSSIYLKQSTVDTPQEKLFKIYSALYVVENSSHLQSIAMTSKKFKKKLDKTYSARKAKQWMVQSNKKQRGQLSVGLEYSHVRKISMPELKTGRK